MTSSKKNVCVIPYVIYLKLRGPLFKFGLESQRIYKNAITYDSTFKMSTNYHYCIQGTTWSWPNRPHRVGHLIHILQNSLKKNGLRSTFRRYLLWCWCDTRYRQRAGKRPTSASGEAQQGLWNIKVHTKSLKMVTFQKKRSVTKKKDDADGPSRDRLWQPGLWDPCREF